MSRIVALVLGVALIAASCAGDAAAGTTTTSVGPSTVTVTEPFQPSQLGNSVAGVSLPDASIGGADFEMVPIEGHVLAVYFGYTTCPDVCPTTMADLRSAIADLGDDGERVDVAMVTVDPGRDSGETLTEYVQYFIEGAHALRTEDPDQLKAAADAFGADYGVVNLPNGRISAFHTPFLYAVDDRGTIQAVWRFGAEPAEIAGDLASILNS